MIFSQSYRARETKNIAGFFEINGSSSSYMLFDNEKILKSAMFTTGLEDFGGEDFIEPMEILTSDYRTSANLNHLGRIAAWTYLHRMLSNRLRLNAFYKSQKTSEQKIDRPIFIVGLPRTGSTLLHEMMAIHSDLRAPVFWETSFVPESSPTDLFRRWLAKSQIITLNTLSPGFKAVHRLGTEQPHECITMQAASLRSMQFHAANNVKNYNDWLKECDWEPAYRYHEIFLKCLQAHKSETPKRWILKAPGHLLSMPALFEKYPDSKIIQLHRDPSEVIPSMASLFFHIRRPFTSSAVKEEIGADVKTQWFNGISATMKYRTENPEKNSRFIDINYKSLILDPLRSLEEIGTHCDLKIGENYAQLIKNYLDDHPKGKHGRHQYNLKQFGLCEHDLNSIFKEYREKHIG